MTNLQSSPEVWADIPGYDGVYQASNYGSIKSIDRQVIEKTGRVRLIKGRTMKVFDSQDGYKVFSVSKKNKYKNLSVHRVVCSLFVCQIPESYEVNHKDFVKTNNHFTNLEVVTSKENILHAIGMMGYFHHQPKSIIAYRENSTIVSEFKSINKASISLGIHRLTISNYLTGKPAKTNGYYFELL